jgi:protein O-mannosyl-transferase
MLSQTIGREQVSGRAPLVVYLSLAALVWSVFGQTLGHQFVNYDDQTYVYENPEVAAGVTAHGLVAAFTHPHARNWHPLTTLSHMLDCQLFGLNPGGHHLTNVLLHTAAVLLLFSVLHEMTGALWRSAFVAAVFAIHPQRVESVAWIAERKDVLSALFFMLTLGAYLHYIRRASFWRYLWIALFFGCGLMAKPMLVTLPFLLLLLDYWPLGRFQQLAWPRLLLEKVPFLFFALLSAMATLLAQGSTVAYAEQRVPFIWRLSNGLASYVAYLGQMFWPAKLAVFYPYAADRLSWREVALIFLLIAGMTTLFFACRRTRPYLLVGWLWYVIGLLPVIGLVQVGLQGRADRYTYLPHIGLYIACTWMAADLTTFSKQARQLAAAAAAIIISALAWRAWMQTSYWRNTESLWQHALEINPDNDVAQYNAAMFSIKRGRVDEAIAHYETALRLHPNDNETQYHLSPALLHNGLGNALRRQGRLDEALAHYRKAVDLRDDLADAHSNLAALLAQRGQTSEAIAQYEKAIAIPPEDAASHLNLAALLSQSGRDDQAIVHYRRALQIAPQSVAVLNALAWILTTSSHDSVKNPIEAVALAEKANELTEGKDPLVLRTLAATYAEVGRSTEAIAAVQRALSSVTDPNLALLLEHDIELYRAGATQSKQ